jgi:cellobiose phosphorylase
MSTNLRSVQSLQFRSASGFGLLELQAHDGLKAQLLPNGALHAIRHEGTLINQFLPGPAEDGLFRLLLRWRTREGAISWTPVVGPSCEFVHTGPTSASWETSTAVGLESATSLEMHPRLDAWAWRVNVRNTSKLSLSVDMLTAQDLGLADEPAVRNNEAYNSQYIDLLPVHDEALGWTILARQNQAMAEGRFPWLAHACTGGAIAFCTDGIQFFGKDHRITGEPAAVRLSSLPSKRLQYECALAGLQTRTQELAPDESVEFVFVSRYLADHPTASGEEDIALIRELPPVDSNISAPKTRAAPGRRPSISSHFVDSQWSHGAAPTENDWSMWFPGARRHEERGTDGQVHSFFHGNETHVVSRAKEASILRPHGHILRSGTFDWIDNAQFGVTSYAAGIFGAQAYLGNPNLGRLLSVVRNSLGVARASGQRVFLRRNDGAWHQLGVPSAFVMQAGEMRWIYVLDNCTLEARVWCSRNLSASYLSLEVTEGDELEFLVTHQLSLGEAEFVNRGDATIFADAGWAELFPDGESNLRIAQPGACFAIAAADPNTLSELGGDGLLYPDGVERGGPYVTLRSMPGRKFGVIMLGTNDGKGRLPSAVTAARTELNGGMSARAPASPMKLNGADPEVARVNEILPWFAHNAAIHFAAPHGLEQCGGGAWGVRDVCQGSIEWLLAAGEFAIVRRVLTAVFEQQYASRSKKPSRNSCWPQWFMPEPFRHIQQVHSHGDVCFWPLKALCDYVEASNDFSILQSKLRYTRPARFAMTSPVDTLWEHCDRVVAHCEARFIAGTALVNYGEGDWDDTLQPANPSMRTRMVSTWTVALAYQTFSQLADLSRRAGEPDRAERLEGLVARMREDFGLFAMPDGTVAGFLVRESRRKFRPLLHPSDAETGIRYRLLPMTRSIIAGLFTAEEARRHASLIQSELHFADGVRLMSEPAIYAGGLEKLFKRADTAANIGREIGLQYVHAHIRYAEAMARLGDADRLWQALQVVNPVGIEHAVPGAVARQRNVYFTSSDADFADRIEAHKRWQELRAGRVAVRGGWRLYSSGPGLYINKVRSCLLGIRESFGDVVFDPVLPRRLDGLVADVRLLGKSVRMIYSVSTRTSSPSAVRVNGNLIIDLQREANPYRPGGVRVDGAALAASLTAQQNCIEIDL